MHGPAMALAYAAGRICVPVVFIIYGFRKFMDVGSVSAQLAERGIAMPPLFDGLGITTYDFIGYAVAAIEVVFGLMILVGLKARFAAAVLCLFTVATIFVGHDFWNQTGAAAASNEAHAIKNIAIIGALLMIVGVGSGPLSVDGSDRAN